MLVIIQIDSIEMLINHKKYLSKTTLSSMIKVRIVDALSNFYASSLIE